MAVRRAPALFISHGGPPLAIDTKDFLHPFFKQQLPKMLPAAPTAIVVVSAHYEKANFRVTSAARPRTIYDFGGFSPKLYQLTYPAPGDPQLAKRIVSMIKGASLSAEEDETWGFDHGSWIPLYLMYPKAEVPVLQVSLTKDFDAQKMLALGKALRPLRDEGILLIGSGSTTHNLYEADFGDADAPVEPWAKEFAAWVHKSAALPAPEREAALLQYAKQPTFRRAHPREEHWMPIFFALGAADSQEKVQILADRILCGSLAVSTLLWE